MAKADIYTIKGTKKEGFTFPKGFDEKINIRLLAQAMRVYEDNLHPGLNKAKTRGEVLRTTKKLYKQKGTGGARHGSRRAPIFVGGGVAFGPRPLKRILSLPTKLRRKALSMALSAKLESKELVVVEGFDGVKKTNDANVFLKSISKNSNLKRYTFVLSDKNRDLQKFTTNLKDAKSVLYKDLNAHTVFFGGLIVLDKDIFEVAKKVVTKEVPAKVVSTKAKAPAKRKVTKK